MKVPDCITIDFETNEIESRPKYPPVPVGFSIMYSQERKSTYHAWGHPTQNNTTKSEAQNILRGAWKSKLPLLFKHAKFDVDVAQVHMGMDSIPWSRIHDAEYLLFLNNPHTRNMKLKEAAQEILGIAPKERDAVQDWVMEHIKPKKKSEWGKYICKVPGALVGKYADGDVTRTWRLFKHLLPSIDKRGMMPAYLRECELMPILLENEREGIRCDLKLLEHDYSMYQKALDRCDVWLGGELKCPGLNLDADVDVGKALHNSGMITNWVWTKGGHGRAPQRSVAKKNLTIAQFRDKRVALVWAYRNKLRTCLSMFFETWLVMARQSGGVIYTNWNQVRQERGGGSAGARTGRISSNPNFQNIPKDFEDNGEGYTHPKFMRGLPPLPLMRRYLIPDPGDVWGHRDYNQQEYRIAAHYEDGRLCKQYNEDPHTDVHTAVGLLLQEAMGYEIPRREVKVANFLDLYGGGAAALAAKTGITLKKAYAIKAAKARMLPDMEDLKRQTAQVGKDGEAITTWGGRQYYCEPPVMWSKRFGRPMTFEYKLLNYLVQGSAADCTKQALIQYHNHPKRKARFLLTVHDELNASMPKNRIKEEMKVLREAMENVKFDVPMLSDGKIGTKNWAELTKYKED